MIEAQCPLLIAEAGVNHNGEIELAHRLVDAAVDAGAGAVKFQTFRAERLASRVAAKAAYQKETTSASENQLDMLKRLELSDAAHRELLVHCRDKGIEFLSTPFDEDSAEFLKALGVGRFKIPSGEVINTPFLNHVGGLELPVILSTGMSDLAEVGEAVAALQDGGATDITLLHCVSNYPAAAADINLRAMATMREAFGLPVGYSDHTAGLEIALAAIALGACIVEKHFTLDRSLPGPDHQASIEPYQLKALAAAAKNIAAAFGDGEKKPAASELDMRQLARKSLVATRDIAAGSTLQASDLAAKRPGSGLSPARIDSVVGRTLKNDLAEDDLLREADLL